MSTFLSICLYIFAACAVLGLLPASILAAGFVVFVLVASAGELPRH